VTGIDRTNVAGGAAQGDAATIYVCITCRRAEEPQADPRPGALLAAATAAAAQGSGVCARLLAGAGDGLMPWRGRPEPLKRGLIARVPPLGFVEKDFQENFQETIG